MAHIRDTFIYVNQHTNPCQHPSDLSNITIFWDSHHLPEMSAHLEGRPLWEGRSKGSSAMFDKWVELPPTP
jgi:hypothetical protein